MDIGIPLQANNYIQYVSDGAMLSTIPTRKHIKTVCVTREQIKRYTNASNELFSLQ